MVHLAADVAPFIQRRELLAYEQRLARHAYAYGVDLRRSAWLDASTLGEPIMRSIDRRWNALVEELTGSILQDPNKSAPIEVMEEIARLVRLLRAPLPTLRLLARGVKADTWPIVAPLGTTKGAAHWLVLDVERLVACRPEERTFLLAAALGHLQCDHAPMFTAHLMAYRAERGLGLVRTLLRPWSKVAWFSADRAALISLGELEPALAALRVHGDSGVVWMPRPPDLLLREQALADFDKSAVMVRVRVLQQRGGFSLAPPRPKKDGEVSDPDGDPDLSSRSSGPESANRDAVREPGGAATREPAASTAANGGASPPGSDTSTRDGLHGPPGLRADGEEGDPYRNAAREADEHDTTVDEELARALANAWSLARCDQRLTRRLGLI